MVDRFKLLNHGMCDMCEEIRDPNGDMVEYEDYKKLLAQNKEFELAALTAIGNKETAENDERLARLEINRLNALIRDAKARFDDIAAASEGQ